MNKPIDYSYSYITNQKLNSFITNYDINNVVMLPFIKIGNDIYSLNVLSDTAPKTVIRSKEGIFFIKQIPWYIQTINTGISKVELYSHILSFFDDSYKFKKNRFGKDYTVVDDKIYYITTFITSTLSNFSNLCLKDVGAKVAKIHLLPIDKENFPFIEETSIKETLLNLSNLLVESERDIVNEHINQLDFSSVGPEISYIHGDLNPSNILPLKNGHVSIVDFDNIAIDNPIRDIAELIVTFTMVNYIENTSYILNFNKDLNLNSIYLILDEYNSHIPNRILSPELDLVAKAIVLEIYIIGKLRKCLDLNVDLGETLKKISLIVSLIQDRYK